ncbi:hypothetical protein [Actinocrispum wychmicini]|uniref:Uncharacterized protein n=1 Tax=Actinocrispum wychmicini TaxID=1213861 RepID=A0A4R2JC56_9PSEU|nr:hypothetical protein [Actinocrispum wychmicini]TCO57113.1 hypothetical protein EV192_106590 [Actinocrispum wychmicini]
MLTIRSGRHPHEIVLLAFTLLSGLTGFFGYSQAASNAILLLLPRAYGQAFYLGLAASAAIALAGICWRGIVGPLVERAGLLINTGLYLFFALAIFTVGGVRGVGFGFTLIAFSVANVVRVLQIRRDLRAIRAAAMVTDSTDQLE